MVWEYKRFVLRVSRVIHGVLNPLYMSGTSEYTRISYRRRPTQSLICFFGPCSTPSLSVHTDCILNLNE